MEIICPAAICHKSPERDPITLEYKGCCKYCSNYENNKCEDPCPIIINNENLIKLIMKKLELQKEIEKIQNELKDVEEQLKRYDRIKK